MADQNGWLADGGRVEEIDGCLIVTCGGCGETVRLRPQLERVASTKGERVSAARRQAALEGRQPCAGNAPYGYGIVRKLDVMTGRRPLSQLGSYYLLEEEARMVRVIFREYLRRGNTLEVIELLHSNGVPAPDGGPAWSPRMVARILRNPAYIGTARFGRTAAAPAKIGTRGRGFLRSSGEERMHRPLRPEGIIGRSTRCHSSLLERF